MTIEVITGPMFSGKTEEIMRRIRRCELGKRSYACFKHASDDVRYGNGIVSHNRSSVDALGISDLGKIDPAGMDAIFIDEIQFFPSEQAAIIRDISLSGYRVIVSGLDMDWRACPFDTTALLLAMATKIRKLTSICEVCGEEAQFTYKRNKNGERVEVGGKEAYEPRCHKHFLS